MLGHLSHAASVIHPIRTFLRQLFDLPHRVRLPRHSVCLTAGEKADLRGDAQSTLTTYNSGKRRYTMRSAHSTTLRMHYYLLLNPSFCTLLPVYQDLFERCMTSLDCQWVSRPITILTPPPILCNQGYSEGPPNRSDCRSPQSCSLGFFGDGQLNQYVTFDRVMLWALPAWVFLGFMRAGEFTCLSLHSFSPDMLTPDDVAVDSHVSPSYITVHLKCSKNDPLGVGTTIHLGATGASLCPVLAMLARRPCQSGPLFMFREDCMPLS